jgi:hypothetical protein
MIVANVNGVEIPGGAVRAEVDTAVTDIHIAFNPTDHGLEYTQTPLRPIVSPG